VNAANVAAAEVGGATEALLLESDFPKRKISFDRGGLSPVGSIVLFNKERDLSEVYLHKLDFMQDECCQQCVPCRKVRKCSAGGMAA
jgi:NADH:ubiquinone oxidoreductase subunit F (NADH-binding)